MSVHTTPRRVYLSLGSNLGDRAAYLRAALQHLGALPHTQVTAVSALHETPPWGHTEQPAFLNMAVMLTTALSPEALLEATQRIEGDLGRTRDTHWGPRTLDIDILAYEGEERHTAALQLPHPYATQRAFVLAPLAEIAPDLLLDGKTVQEWLERVKSEE
jgi:2-amino-4-hydroxy-6-hydroxymethyldihydropteridine diphosphokinase